MDESNINLASIANVEVRNDGAEIKITFANESEQSVTVNLKREQLSSLMMALMKIMKAVEFNTAAPAELNTKPLEFNQPPPVLLATDLNCAIDPETAHLQIRFLTDEEKMIQVAFGPLEAEEIFRFLRQTKRFDEDQTVH